MKNYIYKGLFLDFLFENEIKNRFETAFNTMGKFDSLDKLFELDPKHYLSSAFTFKEADDLKLEVNWGYMDKLWRELLSKHICPLSHDLDDLAFDEICQEIEKRAMAASDDFHNKGDACSRVLEIEYLVEELKKRAIFTAI